MGIDGPLTGLQRWIIFLACGGTLWLGESSFDDLLGWIEVMCAPIASSCGAPAAIAWLHFNVYLATIGVGAVLVYFMRAHNAGAERRRARGLTQP